MGILLSVWKKLPDIHSFRAFLLRQVNDQFLIGVTGIIFNEKNEVLLVKHTYRRVPWSLPGGYLKTKEHPKVGLTREIYEETGFRVKIKRAVLTKTNHDGKIDISYFGILVSGRFRSCDEVSHHRFADPAKLPPLITDQYEQIAEALVYKKAYDRRHRWAQTTHIIKRLFTFH